MKKEQKRTLKIVWPIRWLWIGMIAIVSGVILFLFGFMEYSTSPAFCPSCHIMEPYYQAWRGSSHNFVACVECHYPPGKPQTILWKKFQAMSQVVKYVTRTYSSKPYAEIDDASCLRSECHSSRLLIGKGKVVTESNIIFDHRPHLMEERRDRQLRCTSCHSQIVVGRHVEVTWETCILCHFRGKVSPRGAEPIGGCLGCHRVTDKPFTLAGITNTHMNILMNREGVCQDCHRNVIQGEGEALRDRCLICHNQPEKVERIGELPFIHETHITKHSVACFHCHKEMEHKATVVPRFEYNCNTCHTKTHSPQLLLYTGRGGQGLPDMPGGKYQANVDCMACHPKPKTNPSNGSTEITFTGSINSCPDCHNKKFVEIADSWKTLSNSAFTYLEPRLKNLKARIEERKKSPPSDRKETLETALARAEHNLSFVRAADGIHNIYYAAQILRKVKEDLEAVAKGLNIKLSNPDNSPFALGGADGCNILCHDKIGITVPPETVKYKGKEMSHTVHKEMGLTCENCHRFDWHKKVQLIAKPEDCQTCHEI